MYTLLITIKTPDGINTIQNEFDNELDLQNEIIALFKSRQTFTKITIKTKE